MYKNMYGVIQKIYVKIGWNFFVASLELRTRKQSFCASLGLLSASCNLYVFQLISCTSYQQLRLQIENLLRDSDEEEFVGFSREELGIHSDVEVGKYERSMMKLLRKLSTENGQEPWKQRISYPFQWWILGLQIPSMKIIQSWTFLDFLSWNFGERNQLVCSAESRSEARSERKRNNFYFWLPRCWFSYERRQHDELASTEIVI